ncbi:MAG: LysE family transporter [Pseudomonadota bacterium]
MTLAQIFAFNLALLVAIASPGPALLVALQTALSSGRLAGIAVGCGLGLMASIWTLLALVGLDAVFSIVPWAYAAAKIAGALYLFYIAWQMWAGARDAITAGAKPARRAFRDGFLINVLNPKSVLFAAAVLVVIFPPGLGVAEIAFITLNHLVVEIACYAALACAMTTPRVRDAYLRAKVYIDRVAASVLGALGLRLLIARD